MQSSLTALGEKCRPTCVGIKRERRIAAGAMVAEIGGQPRGRTVLGVVVVGGENMELRARTPRATALSSPTGPTATTL